MSRATGNSASDNSRCDKTLSGGSLSVLSALCTREAGASHAFMAKILAFFPIRFTVSWRSDRVPILSVHCKGIERRPSSTTERVRLSVDQLVRDMSRRGSKWHIQPHSLLGAQSDISKKHGHSRSLFHVGASACTVGRCSRRIDSGIYLALHYPQPMGINQSPSIRATEHPPKSHPRQNNH